MGEMEGRRSGSSGDRSCSLTPAMIVGDADEDWLLDDE